MGGQLSVLLVVFFVNFSTTNFASGPSTLPIPLTESSLRKLDNDKRTPYSQTNASPVQLDSNMSPRSSMAQPEIYYFSFEIFGSWLRQIVTFVCRSILNFFPLTARPLLLTQEFLGTSDTTGLENIHTEVPEVSSGTNLVASPPCENSGPAAYLQQIEMSPDLTVAHNPLMDEIQDQQQPLKSPVSPGELVNGQEHEEDTPRQDDRSDVLDLVALEILKNSEVVKSRMHFRIPKTSTSLSAIPNKSPIDKQSSPTSGSSWESIQKPTSGDEDDKENENRQEENHSRHAIEPPSALNSEYLEQKTYRPLLVSLPSSPIGSTGSNQGSVDDLRILPHSLKVYYELVNIYNIITCSEYENVKLREVMERYELELPIDWNEIFEEQHAEENRILLFFRNFFDESNWDKTGLELRPQFK